MEHGTQRRFLAECHVDMPVVTEAPELIGHLYDLDELGMAFDAVNEGILLEIPEPPCEIQLLNRRQGLVAKEDDKMIVERLKDGGPGRVIERLRKIDAMDFSTQRRGDRTYVEGCRIQECLE